MHPCNVSLHPAMMPLQADEEARDLNLELMEKLLDLDDVDAVFSNQKD